jgi:hypothetical protein
VTDPNATATDTHVDGDPFAEDPRVDNDEHSELPDPPPRQRRPFNRQGMGGNQNYHNQHYVRNNDLFAKVKFSILPFNGSYDAETYLEWEMTVEQKFSFHLVTEQHRVRQATSEFKDFALIWWNESATLGLQPHRWDGLKTAMRQRFVPPSYQCDLRKKLQRLDQEDMSVPDYYAELQKAKIHAGVHEETEDKICRFYGGCELKFRILLTIKNTILLIICSSLLCWREGIAGLTTDKSEELIHASSSIDDTFNFTCTSYNSFFDDTFDFTCAFHIDDITTSTSCFRDDTTSTSCSSKTVFIVNHIHRSHL